MTAFANIETSFGAPTRKPVAIKVMHKDSTSSAGKEACIYAALDRTHPGAPHIINLRETFFSDGHACMTFDQHGVPLSRWLRKNGRMSVDDVRLVSHQLLMALDALHDTGFAHGDLKPGNLLWDEETKQLRVIDLGLARRDYRLGQGIATRDYCPPEMLIGLPLEKPVDLWMTACTLYELLTGECLFDPIAACRAKYKECEIEEEPQNSPEIEQSDATVSKFRVGDVLGGKYVLLDQLGEGSFGTVWSALPLHERALNLPLPGNEECERIEQETLGECSDDEEFGYNIWQVVIGYEHFLQMQELLGHYPKRLARKGKFRDILYDDGGNFRFTPQINVVSMKQRLARFLPEKIADDWEKILIPMLSFNPSTRPEPGSLARELMAVSV